jgi:hypothetical protein
MALIRFSVTTPFVALVAPCSFIRDMYGSIEKDIVEGDKSDITRTSWSSLTRYERFDLTTPDINRANGFDGCWCLCTCRRRLPERRDRPTGYGAQRSHSRTSTTA